MTDRFRMILHKERLEMKQEEDFQVIHILFGDSPAGSLRVALKDLGRYKMEKVISFWDMFSMDQSAVT